jgi:hypothetical protein
MAAGGNTSAVDMMCSICLELYDQPIRLPCEHSFCKKCVFSVRRHAIPGARSIKCPECRQVARFSNLTGGFPKNRHLANIVETYKTKVSWIVDYLR